jgi:hypothetical protein
LTFEGSNTFFTLNDLRRIVSSKESVGLISHVTGSHAERHDWSLNDAIFEKGPKVVVLLSSDTFLWG